MTVSVFQLFKIGIGPSSSHTVGPMKAARLFLENAKLQGYFEDAVSLSTELFGSLALTGIGHGTDKAVLMGLEGEFPETVDPASVDPRCDKIQKNSKLDLLGFKTIHFSVEENIKFHQEEQLPFHSNGMRFSLYDASAYQTFQQVFYSIGGGFVMEESEMQQLSGPETNPLPYPFSNASELLELCENQHWSIAELIHENEKSWQNEHEIHHGLQKIWEVMQECIQRGLDSEEIYLPGGLHVRRRAKGLFQELNKEREQGIVETMDWVSLYAIAVNEENAAGRRVVTAPTNGAAGVIPAVMHYCFDTRKDFDENAVAKFLLTAAGICILFKEGASLSAAEVGCQGEIGVACSMAAAGLAAVMGGSPRQVTNAAEIGMEHNLGLTCDPVGGLVQIPCIERNTMGAVKAINAARLSMRGNGEHKISLDHVIATMRRTGEDMLHHYKETSLGGLAVSSTEC
jgi:L-serine dehydratase